MKQETVFKLTGLSKPKSLTCETGNGVIFWPKIIMSQKQFDELWGYLSNNWDGKQRVRIEHDGLSEDGTPINGVVTTFFEEL